MRRREFLRLAGLSVGLAAVAGQFSPAMAQQAGETEESVADPERLDKALREVLGRGFSDLVPSNLVKLVAPTIAESGANVPVEIESTLPPAQVKAMHLFIDRNPIPHVFTLQLGPLASSVYFATRVRLAETAPVRALVEDADGRLLMASQVVRVTLGGCG